MVYNSQPHKRDCKQCVSCYGDLDEEGNCTNKKCKRFKRED